MTFAILVMIFTYTGLDPHDMKKLIFFLKKNNIPVFLIQTKKEKVLSPFSKKISCPFIHASLFLKHFFCWLMACYIVFSII